MVSLFKYFQMDNTIMDIIKRISFKERVFTFGIIDNIFLENLKMVSKFKELGKEKQSILVKLNEICVMASDHATILLERFIKENGMKVNIMVQGLSLSLQVKNLLEHLKVVKNGVRAII